MDCFSPTQDEGKYTFFYPTNDNDNYITAIENKNTKIYDSNYIIIGEGYST